MFASPMPNVPGRGESTTDDGDMAAASAGGGAPAPAGGKTAVTTVRVGETKVTDVTVYVDRAEVTRLVEVVPATVGKHAFKIKGLTDHADTNSVRVQGVPGGLPATILEVSVATLYGGALDDEDQSEHDAKVKRLTELCEAAKNEVATLRAKQKRVEQQDKFLTGFVDTTLGSSGPHHAPPPGYPPSTSPLANDLGKVGAVFSFFEEKAAYIDGSRRELQAELKTAEDKARAAEQELNKYRSSHGRNKPTTEVTIQLATEAEANRKPVALRVSYMVRGASWLPSYDLRASVDPASIQLTYFGMVRQSTGEDWVDAQVSLSTAAPASAGTPPAPPTKHIRWKEEIHMYAQQQVMMKGRSPRMRRAEREMNAMAMPAQAMMDRRLSIDADELDDEEAAFGGAAMPSVEVATAGVKSAGTGTATFEIEHPSTIESDSQEHKVTITVMELEPLFEYFMTPAIDPKAYLQARVVNNSAFPFLESNRGNIFLDGSFITSTTIKAANPGEKFSIFLGSDPSIKVEHRQVKKSSTEGSKGSTFKAATDSAETHEYVTHITNTKPTQKVKCTVVEILPQATDDKITVELLAPSKKLVGVQGDAAADDDVSAKRKAEGKDAGDGQWSITQNKSTNNLVFSGVIAPSEKRKIDFQYSISWPVTAGTGKIEIV